MVVAVRHLVAVVVMLVYPGVIVVAIRHLVAVWWQEQKGRLI
jgi:hypothetical protein